jgi:60 kDa SS-A/Ro ribonucleoprotein
MTNYLKNTMSRKKTPQGVPIPGTSQVANAAGGFVWEVTDWVRLERFLVLGSEGGTFYASQSTLSLANTEATLRCIKSDGLRTVATIVSISESGRAPKNDPAIFALALTSAEGNVDTRRAALRALPMVCRTGIHLMHFAGYVDGMRGWGRALRAAVAEWYEQMPAEKLTYQAVKYQQRDGWSHRDLLRLSHPVPANSQRKDVYCWMTQGWPGVGDEPHPDSALKIVWAFERAKRAQSVQEVTALIRTYRLPREAVPTQWLNDASVWEALLSDMPMTALIRNLATLTHVGLLAEGSVATARVTSLLTEDSRLRLARIHPIAVLSALRTYAQGHGERGQKTWTPVRSVVDALDAAFYASFGNMESTDKRWLLALDVSGSMGAGQIAGVPGLTPRDASAAMAMVTASSEPSYQTVGFTASGANGYGGRWGGGPTGLTSLAISPRQRLDDVIKTISGLPFGGTDCALPMIWAKENKVEVDAFVIYTDSETWAGAIHPAQALQEYREATGIAAKLIVVGMTASSFTIADPEDAGMLDVVGFDTATPQLIANFGQ